MTADPESTHSGRGQFPYQERPVRHRYVVTPRGRDLLPLLREAARWGMRHVPGTFQVPEEMLRGSDRAD